MLKTFLRANYDFAMNFMDNFKLLKIADINA